MCRHHLGIVRRLSRPRERVIEGDSSQNRNHKADYYSMDIASNDSISQGRLLYSLMIRSQGRGKADLEELMEFRTFGCATGF